MENKLPHPFVLDDFETAGPGGVRIWAWFGVGLWLLMAALDWGARFQVFHWQNEWWPNRPHPSLKQSPSATSRLVPAQTGAGLTKMVPVPWIAARYAEYHPAHEEYLDADGYRNPPAEPGTAYPVVLCGDSFLTFLGTQNVAQVLSELAQVPVFNHGRPGAGPFKELARFVQSDRFQPQPKVVVWSLSARELGAPLFLRQPVDYWFDQVAGGGANEVVESGPRILWDCFRPSALRRAWPDTSLIAFLSRQAWAQIKLIVLQAWPRDVLGREDPQFGPMLFYRENLRMLPLLTPGENAAGIVQIVAKVGARLRARNITLVVLLVPEKEQVHAAALASADRAALSCGVPLLAEIETDLGATGVPVVNLMPVFQAATASGHRLYWRDDTHWNDAGIRLAAGELWRKLEPLLK